MAYKAIIFDFDDTLVETKSIRYEAAIYTAKHFYNLELTNSIIDKYWGLPFRALVKALFKNVDSFENIFNNYKSITHLFPLKRFDDAIATLDGLSKEYILALVSASTHELIKSGFKDVGISEEIFEYVQASEDSEYHKPDPKVFDPIKIFLDNKGININEVIYVGDSLGDYFAAKNAGIGFLGIARSKVRIDEFKKNKAEYVLTLSQIAEYLETHG